MRKTLFACIIFLSMMVCAYAGIAYASTYELPHNTVVTDTTAAADWDGKTNFIHNHYLEVFDEYGNNYYDVEFEIQYRKNYVACRKVDVRADKTDVENTTYLFGVRAHESSGNGSSTDGKMCNFGTMEHVEVTASYSSLLYAPTYIYGEVFTCSNAYMFDATNGRSNWQNLFIAEYDD